MRPLQRSNIELIPGASPRGSECARELIVIIISLLIINDCAAFSRVLRVCMRVRSRSVVASLSLSRRVYRVRCPGGRYEPAEKPHANARGQLLRIMQIRHAVRCGGAERFSRLSRIH